MKPKADELTAPVYPLPTGKIEIKPARASEIISSLGISESEKRRASKVLASVLKRAQIPKKRRGSRKGSK
jgi:hypothetical protein